MNEQQVLTLREAEIANGLTVNTRRWRAARLGWLGPRSWVARGRHQEMPGALRRAGWQTFMPVVPSPFRSRGRTRSIKRRQVQWAKRGAHRLPQTRTQAPRPAGPAGMSR